ncbi:MAG: SGNH/GDSL hydrolase family protein [Flavobacteriales bacterium]
MKSGQKLLGLLLILIGLLLNPLALSGLFSNDGSISTPTLLAAIIFFELIVALLGVIVYRTGRFSNIGLSIISPVFVLFLSVGADRFYGAFIMPETANLLFPAFSKAEHNTSEFGLNVQINNLGFRGSNTSIEKTKKRVLVIGDSFTFGWGVETQETWIHRLSESYPEIEFLNLGQGGNHPGDFVRIAKKAIPLLKPDLVMICVLEGNDIHQLMRVIEHENDLKKQANKVTGIESNTEKISRYTSILYPYLTKRFPAKASIQKRWVKDAEDLLSDLSEVQKEKYNSLTETIKSQFELGRLNPSLIYESIHHPNLFRDAVDTSGPLCQKAIVRLHDHLLEIETIASENAAKTVVVSLPNRPYGFPSEIDALNQLGFSVNGCDLLDGNLPTKLALSQTETTALYPSIKGDSLFYKYDGHWNANGNRIFAQELIKQLDTLPAWKHFLTSSSF